MTQQFVMAPAGEHPLAPFAASLYPGLPKPGVPAHPDSAGIATPPLTGDGATMVPQANVGGGVRSLLDPGHPTAWLVGMGVLLLFLLQRGRKK